MKPCFISLPFSIPDVNHIGKAEGLAKISAAGVILEFEVQYLGGLLKPGVQEVWIPLEEIEAIDLRKSWLKTKLEITLNSMETLSKVPNSEKGIITLHLARKSSENAERAIAFLHEKLTEQKMMRGRRTDFQQLLDDDLPDTQTLNK
jgi:hypothetical protein